MNSNVVMAQSSSPPVFKVVSIPCLVRRTTSTTLAFEAAIPRIGRLVIWRTNERVARVSVGRGARRASARRSGSTPTRFSLLDAMLSMPASRKQRTGMHPQHAQERYALRENGRNVNHRIRNLDVCRVNAV